MPDGYYVKDQAGWDALATGPEMTAAVEAVLARGTAIAIGLSPRSTAEERAYFAAIYGASPGARYADSFESSTRVVRRSTGPRVEGELRNTADHAAAVEYGNAKVRQGRHVMARTAEALGGAAGAGAL